jgi:uncharacterized damage-inducible protein DinB
MSKQESQMRSKLICFVGVTILGLGCGGTLRAQNGKSAMASSSSAAASGARAEFLEEISFYEQRYIRLAETIPADKYNWRPAQGVRSIGEVFAHIVAANYGIARALGTQPPAGVDFKAIAAAAGDKAKTVQGLKDSFAHFRKAILALTDADADKPQKMFGRDTTQRGSFFMVTGHMGEHLGQSIAYARVNDIVPPWTAEAEQQKSADKPKP